MNTTELKKLAEAATPIETELYGDRYFQGPFSCATLNKEQDAYIAVTNPAAILKLLAINADLVEALQLMVSANDRAENMSMFPTSHALESLRFQTYDSVKAARTALAKVEGLI